MPTSPQANPLIKHKAMAIAIGLTSIYRSRAHEHQPRLSPHHESIDKATRVLSHSSTIIDLEDSHLIHRSALPNSHSLHGIAHPHPQLESHLPTPKGHFASRRRLAPMLSLPTLTATGPARTPNPHLHRKVDPPPTSTEYLGQKVSSAFLYSTAITQPLPPLNDPYRHRNEPLRPKSITYDNPTPETSRALVFLDACDGHPSGRGGGGRVRQTCVGTSVTELGMLESRRR